MDLLNLTETEGPLREANSNESELYLKGNAYYFDVVEYWSSFEWNKHRCTYVHLLNLLDDLHYSMYK